MQPALARAIDRFFIALMKPGVRPRGRPAAGMVEEGRRLVRELEEAAVRFGPRGFLSRRELERPRPERFAGLLLRWRREPFALPVPPARGRPLAAHVYCGRSRPRAGLVLVHGWRQRALGAVGRFGRYCAARGLAAVCLELPEHLSRRPRGVVAGEGLLSLEAGRMLGWLFQAVFEVEWLRRGLEEALEAPAGTLGVSIGGWVAALHATVFEPGFCCLVNPLVDPVGVLREGTLLEPLRRALAEEELEVLAGFLELVSPLGREPLLPGRLVSVVTGRQDLVTPYEGVSAYAAAVGARPMRVTAHGHFSTLFFYPGLFRDVHAEVEALVEEAEG